jgi:hypothetical protein
MSKGVAVAGATEALRAVSVVAAWVGGRPDPTSHSPHAFYGLREGDRSEQEPLASDLRALSALVRELRALGIKLDLVARGRRARPRDLRHPR